MRRRRYQFTDEAALDLLTEGSATRITSSFPPGARICGWQNDLARAALFLIVEHESFEDVDPGLFPPEYLITISDLRGTDDEIRATLEPRDTAASRIQERMREIGIDVVVAGARELGPRSLLVVRVQHEASQPDMQRFGEDLERQLEGTGVVSIVLDSTCEATLYAARDPRAYDIGLRHPEAFRGHPQELTGGGLTATALVAQTLSNEELARELDRRGWDVVTQPREIRGMDDVTLPAPVLFASELTHAEFVAEATRRGFGLHGASSGVDLRGLDDVTLPELVAHLERLGWSVSGTELAPPPAIAEDGPNSIALGYASHVQFVREAHRRGWNLEPRAPHQDALDAAARERARPDLRGGGRTMLAWEPEGREGTLPAPGPNDIRVVTGISAGSELPRRDPEDAARGDAGGFLVPNEIAQQVMEAIMEAPEVVGDGARSAFSGIFRSTGFVTSTGEVQPDPTPTPVHEEGTSRQAPVTFPAPRLVDRPFPPQEPRSALGFPMVTHDAVAPLVRDARGRLRFPSPTGPVPILEGHREHAVLPSYMDSVHGRVYVIDHNDPATQAAMNRSLQEGLRNATVRVNGSVLPLGGGDEIRVTHE